MDAERRNSGCATNIFALYIHGSCQNVHFCLRALIAPCRETDRWLKRWCQLKQYTPPGGGAGETGPALFYFKKKTDTAPSKVRDSVSDAVDRIFV